MFVCWRRGGWGAGNINRNPQTYLNTQTNTFPSKQEINQINNPKEKERSLTSFCFGCASS